MILSLKTQWREPKKVMGIVAAIPVAVAMFALIAPAPRCAFMMRLIDRFTIIARV